MFDIYAGKTALKTIEEQGFNESIFSSFIGASGGPKWFALYGWDKYIFGEFFKQRKKQLDIIGSSAGAFRAACFTQRDPVAAIERLAKNYSETRYSDNAKPAEITAKARELLDIMLGNNGVDEIINNPIFKAHFFVAKSGGVIASERKSLQALGLVKSYLLNRKNRALLAKQYERFVFSSTSQPLSFGDPDNIATRHVRLTADNLKPSLLASGAIPMVMQGIKDIPGCPKGMYRDGGIIDYHFDLNIQGSGLVLYPHFNASPKAGWFDKSLKRNVHQSSYDNVVLICPAPAFIEALPYQKIPDRTDFTVLDPDARLKYWRQVFNDTERLAEHFDRFITQQDIGKIKVFSD